jgi:hypothetical protein
MTEPQETRRIANMHMDAKLNISVTPRDGGKVRLKLDSKSTPCALSADMDAATTSKVAAAMMDAAGITWLRVADDGTYVAETRAGAVLGG